MIWHTSPEQLIILQIPGPFRSSKSWLIELELGHHDMVIWLVKAYGGKMTSERSGFFLSLYLLQIQINSGNELFTFSGSVSEMAALKYVPISTQLWWPLRGAKLGVLHETAKPGTWEGTLVARGICYAKGASDPKPGHDWMAVEETIFCWKRRWHYKRPVGAITECQFPGWMAVYGSWHDKPARNAEETAFSSRCTLSCSTKKQRVLGCALLVWKSMPSVYLNGGEIIMKM